MTSTTVADKDSLLPHSASVALLKTDVLGRMQTPSDRRDSILAEFDRSGLSAPRFAKLVGIKYSTFAQWVQKRRRRPRGHKSSRATSRSKARASLRLIEAVVEPKTGEASSAVLVVQLPGGARMELSNASQLPLATGPHG